MRYAGLVICRQRPGTAGGGVFMTLKRDGFVNVVLWQRFSKTFNSSENRLCRRLGKLQVESGVVNLVASLCGFQNIFEDGAPKSRDFC